MAEIEIDLGKEKIKVEESVGKLIIAHRDADKAERRALAEEAARLKSQVEAEANKAAQALKDKEIAEAAKAGDIEKLKEVLTKENNSTVERLTEKYRDTHLEALVMRNPNLLKHADDDSQRILIDDLVALLKPSCTFDLKSDTLQVVGKDGRPALGSDGKPKAADAFVSEFLEARLHMRRPAQSQGSGAAGSGSGNPAAQTITRKQFDHKNADQQRAIAAGKIKVVD